MSGDDYQPGGHSDSESRAPFIRFFHDSLLFFAVVLARIGGSPIVRAECIEK